jgi:hypothetical protein
MARTTQLPRESVGQVTPIARPEPEQFEDHANEGALRIPRPSVNGPPQPTYTVPLYNLTDLSPLDVFSTVLDVNAIQVDPSWQIAAYAPKASLEKCIAHHKAERSSHQDSSIVLWSGSLPSEHAERSRLLGAAIIVVDKDTTEQGILLVSFRPATAQAQAVPQVTADETWVAENVELTIRRIPLANA